MPGVRMPLGDWVTGKRGAWCEGVPGWLGRGVRVSRWLGRGGAWCKGDYRWLCLV